MGNICIVSNNPLALAKYAAIGSQVEGGVMDVFMAARGRIHQGAKLINHPLSGSVKPNQSPYKSLVLSTDSGNMVDFMALSLIEGAVEVLKKLTELNRNYTPAVHNDFQVIDLDLLDSAIKALPAEYHM